MMVRTYSPNPEFMPSSRWRESCGTRGAISGGSFFSSVSIAVVMLLTLASRPLAASPCIPAADQPTLVEACSGKSVGDACAWQVWVGTCQVNDCGILNFDGQATPDIIECYLTSPADAAVSYEDGGFEVAQDSGAVSEASADASAEASPQLGPDTFDAGGTPTRVKSGGCSCRAAGDLPGNTTNTLVVGVLAALLGFILRVRRRVHVHK